jgi:hypothetical protein
MFAATSRRLGNHGASAVDRRRSEVRAIYNRRWLRAGKGVVGKLPAASARMCSGTVASQSMSPAARAGDAIFLTGHRTHSQFLGAVPSGRSSDAAG